MRGSPLRGIWIALSRGGSDITGSILAASVGADVYENWTDVDSVFAVNPNLVKNPFPIAEITYDEMRELSYAGFTVLHEEAIYPVFARGIPLNIKNTWLRATQFPMSAVLILSASILGSVARDKKEEQAAGLPE